MENSKLGKTLYAGFCLGCLLAVVGGTLLNYFHWQGGRIIGITAGIVALPFYIWLEVHLITGDIPDNVADFETSGER